jgi:hypothetical protein
MAPQNGTGLAAGETANEARKIVGTGERRKSSRPNPNQSQVCSLAWRRDGDGWLLVFGRRRFGRVVPDQKYPGMWRSVKPGGQLSDMANLSWAKNAVLIAAERELEFEDRLRRATHPPKCPEKRGSFSVPSSLVRQNGRRA